MSKLKKKLKKLKRLYRNLEARHKKHVNNCFHLHDIAYKNKRELNALMKALYFEIGTDDRGQIGAVNTNQKVIEEEE